MNNFRNKLTSLISLLKVKIIKEKKYIYLLSFFIPILILLSIYIARGIYPFGDRMYLARDMYHQYAPFFSEFHNKLTNGGSLTYSWNIGLGTNFTGLYAYYLASPLNWLLLLFKREHLIEVMSLFIILKISLSSVTCTYYLRKNYNRRDLIGVVISLFYALSAYIAAYAWNIMWLDCIVLLPLIILGVEKLVKENDGKLYLITLGLSIISNYYISYMICIYLVLYFLLLLFTNDTKKNPTYFKQRISKFLIFSILAGTVSAFLIVPEYFALKATASGNINFPDTIKKYFSIYEILSRGLMNNEVSATTAHDPNIYSSVLVYLLLPLYWMRKSKNTKEKIGKTLLLGFFIISFNFNILNYLWHGFHFPNSLPARQSFIFIFLILTMAYESLINIKDFKDKEIYRSFVGTLVLFLSYEHFLVGEGFVYEVVYSSLLFLIAYMFVLQMYRKIKEGHPGLTRYKRNLLTWLFVMIAITEVTINFNSTALSTTSRTSYTNDNKDIEYLLEEIKDKEEGEESFYRVEKFKRRSKNDSAWHGYKGASIFSSTSNNNLNEFLKSLGFEKSMNAQSFYGQTPLSSSIFSVKYIFSKEELTQEYKNLFTLMSKSNNEYMYRNNFTLPLGFMVPEEFNSKWNTELTNPFIVQNDFAKAISNNKIFDQINIINNKSTVTLEIDNTDQIYIYVPTRSAKSLEFSVTDKDGVEISTETYDNHNYSHIVNIGSYEPGDFVHITSPDVTSDLRVHGYSFNEDLFMDLYNQLSEQAFNVETFEDTYIKGNIKAREDGLMFTSIPYDQGWTVSVDGEETEAIAFKDALIAIPLSAGNHTIELAYKPQGLKEGMIISLISLVLFMLILIGDKKILKSKGGQE